MSRLNVANFRHPDGTADNINLTSTGRVGIGTTSPATPLTLDGGDLKLTTNTSTTRRVFAIGGTGGYTLGTSGGAAIAFIRDGSNNDDIAFETHVQGSSHAERARITSAGDLRFNSGYGSAATAYGVRAWINFAGDGSNIGTGRGSGNMDAVTDNGTGRYTMNFTNDMPDTNYSAYGSCAGDTSATGDESKITFAHTSRAVGSIAVRVVDPVNDPLTVSIAIIR